jgi:hypothetical protein
VAGYYRILLPSGPRCVLPDQVGSAALASRRDVLVVQGQLAAAGALASALIEREQSAGRPADAIDAATAALGGYTLTPAQIPGGALGDALRTLMDGLPRSGLAAAAARAWPSPLEELAAQTAWAAHAQVGTPAERQAAASTVERFAVTHAGWPTAISNAAAVWPPSEAVFRRLAARGARGVAFDTWRWSFYSHAGPAALAIESGLAVIADDVRADDPVDAGNAELALAGYPGVSGGCALYLLRHAAARPGMLVAVPTTSFTCTQPQILRARDP